jgi:hypothetical protein
MNERPKIMTADQAGPKPRRKHRLLPAVLIVASALLLLVALAPTILSLGVFRGTILAQAESALPARLAADGLSLSWLGSQEIRGLSVTMTDGERVAKVDRAVLEQGLVGLLMDRSHIAAVRVEKGEIWASGLAKLQEAFTKLPAKPKPPETPPRAEEPPMLPAAVRLADITIHSRKGSLHLAEAVFETEMSAGAVQDRLTAIWQIESPEGRGEGTLKAAIAGLRTDWRGWADLGANGTLQCKDVSVATLCSLAAELGTDVQGSGRLTGDFGFRRERSGAIAVDATCDAAGLSVAAAVLHGDRIALDTLHLEAKASYDRSELQIDRLVLKSPVASAEASGRLTLASAQREPPTGNLSGRLAVSLAPLAAMLRSTLGLQKDITVEAGQLDATIQIRSDEKTASLKLAANITGLRGSRAGKSVDLSQMQLLADADRRRPAPAAPGAPPPDAMAILRVVRVNNLQLTAPFGSVRAAGQLETFTLDANLDLTDTTEKVGQFIDLGGRTAQGTARVHLETRGDLDKGVQLAANLDLADVRLALGAGRIWLEPKAAATIEAAATFTPAHDLATLAVSRLDVDASTVKLAGTGNLNRLPAGWGFSGDVSGSGQVARAASLADVALAVAGGEKPKPATAAPADAIDSRQLVEDLVRRAATAEGQWSLRARIQNADGKALSIAFGAQLANLSLLLGPEGTAPIQISTLAASGAVQQAEGGPWNVSLSSLSLAAPDLSLTAAADATVPVGPDAKPVALHGGSITAEGAVARTLDLADSVLAFLATAAPKPDPKAPAKNASGLESAQKFIHQVAAGSTPPTGRWKLDAKATSAAGKGLSATFEAQASDVTLVLDPKHTGPVRILTVSLTGTAQQPEGGQWHFVVTDGRVATPEMNLAARADVTLPADFNMAGLSGDLAAQANVNLANLAATLQATGMASDLPQITGMTSVTVSAQTGENRRIDAVAKVAAVNLAIAWPDGCKVSEPQVAFDAEAVAGRDAKGGVADIAVTRWSAKVSAGQLAGTAALKPAGEAWAYHVAAAGGGGIEQLAQVVAGATGGKPSTIRGQWKVKGELDQDAAGQRINVAATATDLVVPPEAGTGAGNDLRLADVTLDTQAVIAPTGAIEVSRARLTGPGITATAAGTVRMPKDKSDKMAADGAVSLKADLAELAKLLQPFGLLAPKSVLAGAADLNGKVASSATGVRGAGTLVVAGLDVSLAEAGIVLKEPQATVPLAVEYASGERRWTVTLTGISSALVKGNASGSWTETTPAPTVQVECNLALDGERLTAALGKNLPQGLRFAGAWGISGRASGPLPSAAVPWNQKIAGLAGEGAIELAMFQYEKLSGGKGTLRWRLAGGQILVADPAQPSRLTLAGGRLNLAARVDLKGAIARLIIAQPLLLLEDVPLSDPGVQDYLKFGSAVLAGSVNPEGRLYMEIDSLDLPLAAEEKNKAVGTGKFRIDKFQTELSGPLAALLASYGTPRQSPVQTFGPVLVQLANGILRISEHKLLLSNDETLLFHGNIGLDRSLAFEVNLPITDKMLGRFGANATAVQYLQNQKISVPMTGTIDKPQLDDRVVAKRIGEMVVEAMKRRAVEELGNILKGGLKSRK